MTEVHKFCKYCIGSMNARSVRGDVSCGDICDITHRKIREDELNAGCEDYYDQTFPALLITVTATIEYCDRSSILALEKHTCPVIRIRYTPDMCRDWRADYWQEVYMEALTVISKKYNLPINNGGRWITNNIYKCKPINKTVGENNISSVRIGFTSSVVEHPKRTIEVTA